MNRLGKILLLIILSIACILLIPTNVQAGLQANKNGTSLYSKTASEFFELIRAMETGTLGKNTVGAADGIDCHMVKNTEWGTAAMLAASPRHGTIPATTKTGADTESTTGNKSGVYQMSDDQYEYTANYLVGATAYSDNLINAVNNGQGKYVNVYSDTDAANYIEGDALKLGTIGGNWNTSTPVIHRGIKSLFKANGYHLNNIRRVWKGWSWRKC